MKPLKMWCLKDRYGNLWVGSTIFCTKSDSISSQFTQEQWRERYREGWRCVRVEIKEVEK